MCFQILEGPKGLNITFGSEKKLWEKEIFAYRNFISIYTMKIARNFGAWQPNSIRFIDVVNNGVFFSFTI